MAAKKTAGTLAALLPALWLAAASAPAQAPAPDEAEALRGLAASAGAEAALAESARRLAAPGISDSARYEVLLLRADWLSAAGRPGPATEEMEKAVAIRPADPEAQSRLGRLHASRLEWTKAAAAYERAAALDPRRLDARLELGRIYARERRSAEALKHLQAAAELDPRSLEVHEQLALLYEQTGQTPLAILEWERCIDLDPGGKVGGKAERRIARLKRAAGP